MTYESAITLAHQRMREIGREANTYHIEPVCIVGTLQERQQGEITIKAYNEYYYLVNYEKYFGFTIKSDTGYFNADDYTENTTQEFTGLINISKTASLWNLGLIPPNQQTGDPILTSFQQMELLKNQIVRAIDFVRVTLL
jgi:hypothetical protein